MAQSALSGEKGCFTNDQRFGLDWSGKFHWLKIALTPATKITTLNRREQNL